jgi:hypothetical protein
MDQRLRQVLILENKMDCRGRWSSGMKKILSFLEELPTHLDSGRSAPAELSAGDLVIMNNNMLEDLPTDHQIRKIFDVRLFSVTEKEETPEEARCRAITHTPRSNLLYQQFIRSTGDNYVVDMPTPTECMADVSFKHAAILDLKACFQGITLQTRLRYCCFVGQDGKTKRLKSVPTGASWCPAFAHAWTAAVSQFVGNKK